MSDANSEFEGFAQAYRRGKRAFSELILDDSDMSGFTLENVRIEDSHFVEATLGAKYGKNTEFPDGFNPKAHGMVLAK
jgi:hypothetical protein